MSLESRLARMRQQQEQQQQREADRKERELAERTRQEAAEVARKEAIDQHLMSVAQQHLVPILEEVNSGFAKGTGTISSELERGGLTTRAHRFTLKWGEGEERDGDYDGWDSYWHDEVNVIVDQELKVDISGADDKGRKSLRLEDGRFYEKAGDHIVKLISERQVHHFEKHHFHIGSWNDMA